MLYNKYFSKEAARAILERNKEISKLYFNLYKILENYDMQDYIKAVTNRVLSESKDDEMVLMDLSEKQLCLDIKGLHKFQHIIEGYVGKKEFEKFIAGAERLEQQRILNSSLLTNFSSQNLGFVLCALKNSIKTDIISDYEKKTNIWWCVLELTSRTRIPKLYYFIKDLPMRLIEIIMFFFSKSSLLEKKQVY